jgi:hypothetical protein
VRGAGSDARDAPRTAPRLVIRRKCASPELSPATALAAIRPPRAAGAAGTLHGARVVPARPRARRTRPRVTSRAADAAEGLDESDGGRDAASPSASQPPNRAVFCSRDAQRTGSRAAPPPRAAARESDATSASASASGERGLSKGGE